MKQKFHIKYSNIASYIYNPRLDKEFLLVMDHKLVHPIFLLTNIASLKDHTALLYEAKNKWKINFYINAKYQY